MIVLSSRCRDPCQRGNGGAPTELLISQSGQRLSIQLVRRIGRERHLDQARTESGVQVGFGKVFAVGQLQSVHEIHPDSFPSQGRDESLHMGGYLWGT